MASSLLSTRASLSSSFSLPPSQVSISSSSSSFVSIAYFRHGPLSLESKPESAVLPLVECSSRPQKKCTAHHNKTRPKKHNPYDKNRKPAVYPKLPKAPPIYTLGWPDDVEDSAPATPVEPVGIGLYPRRRPL